MSEYLREDYVGRWGKADVYKTFEFMFAEDGNDKGRAKYYLIPKKLREPKQALQEAKTMFKVDHPNIARVRDIFTHGNVLGAIEEIYDGGDLQQLADKRDWRGELYLQEDKAFRILVQLLVAVRHVH